MRPSSYVIAAVLVFGASEASATIWVVPTPAAPTIQVGLDRASPGDTVAVKCGTYSEGRLVMTSAILFTSELADPECVTLDGQDLDLILDCDQLDGSTLIRGFTFTGGSPGAVYSANASPGFLNCVFEENSAPSGDGGAVYLYYSSPVFTGCTFVHNSSGGNGGAVYAFESGLTLDDCTFRANFAGLDGGALRCVQSEVEITGSTFFLNWAEDGGAIYARNSSLVMEGCLLHSNSVTGVGGALFCYGTPCTVTQSTLAYNTGQQAGGIYLWNNSDAAIANSIIALSPAGAAVTCLDPGSQATLSCCDVYGNAYGDWVGCLSGQSGMDGNFSEDPRFCSPWDRDYGISVDSPCAPENSPPGCQLIGARDVDCNLTPAAREDVPPPAVPGFGENLPNPFHLPAGIEYTLPPDGLPSGVNLTIYDVSGRRVRTLIDAVQGPGPHGASWDGTDHSGAPVASGVYFCCLSWNGSTRTHRMVLVR